MRIKWTLWLVLAGLLVWFFYKQQPKIETEHAETTAISEVAETAHELDEITAEKLSPVSEPQIKPSATEPSELQLILQEIDTRLFSDDPYVEVYSLQSQIGLCKEVNELVSLFIFYQNFTHPKQQKTMDAIKDQCQSYQSLYPNLISQNRKQKLANLTPQSHLGLLLERRSKEFSRMTDAERNELGVELLFAGIREQNGPVLIDASFSQRHNKLMLPQLTSFLGSQDSSYIGQISQLAMVKMACQYHKGLACEPTSELMLLICAQQPNSCGLNFDQWYQTNTLPGMKNDVEILMGYFQSLSE